MIQTGLSILTSNFPEKLKGKSIGLLCHAPSITPDFRHISEIIYNNKSCRLRAIFGPQHGLFGQTQDNMIEWEGTDDSRYSVPVYSLYGKHRKPTPLMLSDIDAFVIDLQDVGARLYTYIWTVKLCMEACAELGIEVWVLDRPNPVAPLPFGGPVLKKEFFTFVGGAEIPLCHRMTIGEMALWIKEFEIPLCKLNVIWMKGWNREMFFNDTGLPWVLPSPNMPTLQTAIVYPGTVLIEALNLSEGRGTTIPFELFGAPYIRSEKLNKSLSVREIPGCKFRSHEFIPTFNKYAGVPCSGMQIHVTDPLLFNPVKCAMHIFDAIIETSEQGSLVFNPPPYEYEENLMPFDILSGDSGMRETLEKRLPLEIEFERWEEEIDEFLKRFREISAYDGEIIQRAHRL